jgi:hypothetical protein
MITNITAEKIHYWLTAAIQFTLVVAIVSSIYTQSWFALAMSVLTLALTFVPKMFEDKYDIRLPVEFEIVTVLFIYASIFLGEVQGYYTVYTWWDALLHGTSAIALGFVGFGILFILDRSSKIQASPSTLAVFTFAFAVAIGAVWEIFEFAVDQIFATNMQKSGLVDTMWDLIVDSIGALIAAVSGYFYLKKEKTFVVSGMLERFIKQNPRLFSKKR